jgi:tetratricopeptide (TPR) repeat protein
MAIDLFKKTLELNSRDIFAHFYLGNNYKLIGEVGLAKKEYEKVIEISPDYSWAYFNLASIAYENDDFETALANLQKTVELNPRDVKAFMIYSQILIKLGQLKKAQELIQNAISENQYEGDLYYVLANIYKLQENMEGYKKGLKLALKNYKTLSVSTKMVKKEFDELSSEEE